MAKVLYTIVNTDWLFNHTVVTMVEEAQGMQWV